jgi:hypothetical protein
MKIGRGKLKKGEVVFAACFLSHRLNYIIKEFL